MELAFNIDRLQVRYGSRIAVHDLNLSLRAGESMGLIGVNGAGKTSTIRSLLGMNRHQGTCTVLGEKPGSIRAFQQIGFAPEEAFPPDFLSIREYLTFCARMKGLSKTASHAEATDLIQWFELREHARLAELSKGMKKRLVLAQAFVGGPKLLILDEPINGLDPVMILKLRERLQQYRAAGGSILYSSHILSEIENCCSEVAILHEGKLQRHCSVAEAKKESGSVELLLQGLVGAATRKQGRNGAELHV